MGSAATVQSVATKPQGNITEPPAVTAVKASSDAPYARATSTPAGRESKNTKHLNTYDVQILHLHLDMLYTRKYLHMQIFKQTVLITYFSI